MKLSAKMERVLNVLLTRPDPSSKEIEDIANVCSARDWIRHLRDKGFKIDMSEKMEFGSRVCRWTLIQEVPVQKVMF